MRKLLLMASLTLWSVALMAQAPAPTQNANTRFEQLGPMLPTPNTVGSSRVDLQACKLEYSIVSPK